MVRRSWSIEVGGISLAKLCGGGCGARRWGLAVCGGAGVKVVVGPSTLGLHCSLDVFWFF